MVLNRLALWRAGARTVRLFPGRERSLEDVHGIVVGGGDDIDVRLYDDALTLDTRIDPDRDALEIRVLRHAEARGLPVLGVCRGAQMLNVYRGGTLHTDVRRAYAGFPRHRTVLAKRWVPTRPTTRTGTERRRAAGGMVLRRRAGPQTIPSPRR